MTLTCGCKVYTWHSDLRSDLILDQSILSGEILQDTINDGSVKFCLLESGKVNIIPVKWGMTVSSDTQTLFISQRKPNGSGGILSANLYWMDWSQGE